MATTVLLANGKRMSNFLDNLINRTFNLERSIQPQLPSLFATMLNHEMAWQTDVPVSDPEMRADAPFSGEGESDISSSFPFSASHPAALQPPAGSQSMPPTAPQRLSEKGVPMPSGLNPQPLTDDDQASLPETRANFKPLMTTPESLREDQMSHTPAQGQMRRSRRLPDRTMNEQAFLAESPKLTPATDNEPPSIQVNQFGILPPGEAPWYMKPSVEAVASVSPKSQLAGSHELTPTIRVNIGRVEVRAIMAPNAPKTQKAPRKSKPVLSLDDYLKRRNGGGI
jgi:hypothetical protein